MHHEGIVPDVVTYSALISACGKGRQSKRALELLEVMRQQGVVPKVITCNALISACEQGAQPDRALKVYESMNP